VGNILFGDVPKTETINLVSPDNTSEGWLKKKWKIIGGKRCLVKGGSDPFQQQPINEAMASVIMSRLNIPHVPYSVVFEEGLPYSVCDNFVTSKTELVSAFDIHNTKRIGDVSGLFDHYLDCCLALGIPDIEINLDKMLAADYLIANSDRHLNNFGAVRDAETLEWVGAAPLFDNGSSLWFSQVKMNIQTSKSQPFRNTHEEQIKLVRDFSWLDFSALNDAPEEFSDLLVKSAFIDDARRDDLCHALERRVAMLEGFVKRGETNVNYIRND
jgi:hypothetical protein